MSIDFSTENGVATVAFNRPEVRNATNDAMRRALGDIFETISVDPSIRAVILTGRGSTFCSGADLEEMGAKDVATARRSMRWGGHRALRAVAQIDKPVVAAVEGAAAGIGFGYALACDFLVAAENAKFVCSHHRVGLASDGGLIWALTRRLGMGRAKRLVYLAKPLSAVDGHAIGIVDELAKPGSALQAAQALAAELAAGPTTAVALSKQLFSIAANSSLDEFLETERLTQPLAWQTEDYTEAVSAFKHKREPQFKGR